YEFELGKAIRRARAYVVGLGYCELRLNGKKVGDRVLDPGFTTFPERALYSTYDVTDQLRTGRNAVGVMLGKGWYGESPRFILQLNVEFADGTCASITTNKDWVRSTSPILRNSLYHGETYDARLEQQGWDSPGFDASKWEPVETTASPTKTLSAEMIQPIRVCGTIKPRKLTNPKPGVWVYDFRQNFSGWCRLKVSGPAGTEVSIRHAEVLYDDGTVNQENLRRAKATDRYILKGEGVETYEPRFTYHGFRYVQIEGFPGTPDLSTLTGCVVHTDFAPQGSFECSNPLINNIHRNACWGYKTNWHSIPTDCPQRDERQGWMGDAHMTADMGLYNFDAGPAYTKWLRDMQDTQGEDGRVPDSVPYIGAWGSNPGDPMWASAYQFITWDMYRHTGDRRLLARHYGGIKRYVDMLAREAKDYIIVRNNYGDWVGVVETPKDLISTGAFYRCSWMVARMAEILGQPNDAKKYDDLCAKIAAAFNKRFFDAKTNNYGNGSQYSNAWPLYLGIVPVEKHDAVVKNLIEDITVKHKGHLSTGFLGARYLLEVLCNEGRADVAYTIVTQKDYPGWGYMISKGATTIWELWKYEVGPGMNSHNHPAFGFVGGWFYRALAGILPNAEHGGFERFDIKPYVVGDLTEAQASVQTVRGPVASHWVRSDNGLILNVTIPGNSTASVWVPKIGLSSVQVCEGGNPVWKNGKFVPGVAGISDASEAGDWIKFEVGSGTYSFRLMSDK
ncbi:MAG: family 78 glycoside hydrolase catalytic domain, partial [Armatimonadetes bacterium]|nr:family 78 glycoside hydrolase catalytic domain [Armatimonadota bacterium]